MTDQLAARLARASEDVDELLDLGCDLADAGRLEDAESCFRRAAVQGSAVALFNLANTLRDLGRPSEAVVTYEAAAGAGESDAWLNLGQVLEELGDLYGAMNAYRAAAAAGDLNGALALGFALRDQGEHELGMLAVSEAVAAGNSQAVGVLACWRWCASLDPSLEAELREGAEHYPPARADLADLLRDTGRTIEVRHILEQGAKLGEIESFLPLGNLYSDADGDARGAEDAYRSGIQAGDAYCHNNIRVQRQGGCPGSRGN